MYYQVLTFLHLCYSNRIGFEVGDQVELQEASVGCALEVRDNGHGIDPDETWTKSSTVLKDVSVSNWPSVASWV